MLLKEAKKKLVPSTIPTKHIAKKKPVVIKRIENMGGAVANTKQILKIVKDFSDHFNLTDAKKYTLLNKIVSDIMILLPPNKKEHYTEQLRKEISQTGMNPGKVNAYKKGAVVGRGGALMHGEGYNAAAERMMNFKGYFKQYLPKTYDTAKEKEVKQISEELEDKDFLRLIAKKLVTGKDLRFTIKSTDLYKLKKLGYGDLSTKISEVSKHQQMASNGMEEIVNLLSEEGVYIYI